MNILVVAATKPELAPFLSFLDSTFEGSSEQGFNMADTLVQILVTGVGTTATAFALGKAFSKKKIDLAINAGIAGSFTEKFPPGTVVHVTSEQFGDLGAEDADGAFLDAFSTGLIGENDFPFKGKKLINPQALESDFLPNAAGLTVQKVHGASTSINRIKEKFSCDIESMEGAAFFYSCLLSNIPFLEIRAISNNVEPRDKDKWQVQLAIQNLNQVLVEMINSF